MIMANFRSETNKFNRFLYEFNFLINNSFFQSEELQDTILVSHEKVLKEMNSPKNLCHKQLANVYKNKRELVNGEIDLY